MALFNAPVLGIPTCISSGAAHVCSLAESSFGQWRALAAYHALVEPHQVDIDIDVVDMQVPSAAPLDVSPVIYRRVGATRLEFAGPSVSGWADAAAGAA